MTLSYKEVGRTALEVYERVYEAHRNIKSLDIKPIKDTPGFYYVVYLKGKVTRGNVVIRSKEGL